MNQTCIKSIGICLAFAGTAYSQKKIPNYAQANLVLGQSDFVTDSVIPTPSAFSLSYPESVIVDPVSRKVFVADMDNGRILRFPNAESLTNGTFAEAVFGKPNFSTAGDTSGDQGLSDDLRGLFLDRRGRLWVADTGNNRVLCYEAAIYRSSTPTADKVIGQPDFATTSAGTTASKLNYPEGVFVDSQDRLWVADYSNSRVLRFDSISNKNSGANADGVLGQPDFVTNGSSTAINRIPGPMGLAVTSSGALFVGDYDVNRVLRFDNAASLANGANASAVLGQSNFTSSSSGVAANLMNTACGVSWTPNDDLWVWDAGNNRILRFEKASTLANGSPAKGVVGQPNFTTNSSNVTNRTLNGPYYFGFVDATGSLWTPDYYNNRVLRFPPDATAPVLTISGSVPKKTTSKSIVIKGTASDAYGVSKVQYRVGSGPVKTATGTTSWQFKATLALGTNTITVNAVDSVGNVSSSKVIKVKRIAKSAP